MKRYTIPREIKICCEVMLRSYPKSKQEYIDRYNDIILAMHPNTDNIRGNISSENKPQSVTEGKALQLIDNTYYRRLEREIEAVESAIKDLDDTKMEIIRQRYWRRPYKNTKISLIDVPYSEAAIAGICRRVIYNVACNAGLIKKGQ